MSCDKFHLMFTVRRQQTFIRVVGEGRDKRPAWMSGLEDLLVEQEVYFTLGENLMYVLLIVSCCLIVLLKFFN